MSLHLTLLTAHPHTPTYLVTAAQTFTHIVIDPTHAAEVETELGSQALSLILLTQTTPAIAEAAQRLHLHTGAPILACSHAVTAGLPVARVLSHGSRIGLGGVAGLAYRADTTTPRLVFHIPSANLAFVGDLLTHPANHQHLPLLPTGTQVIGGHSATGTRYTPTDHPTHLLSPSAFAA